MDLTVKAYIVYLVVSISLTAWVAHTLFKNGRRFLVDVFGGDEELATSVNHLLVVGFYLVNLGFVSFALRHRGVLTSPREAFEMLSWKIGGVLIMLGLAHFTNLLLFGRMRQRSRGRTDGTVKATQGPAAEFQKC
jgi:hypothetical protein